MIDVCWEKRYVTCRLGPWGRNETVRRRLSLCFGVLSLPSFCSVDYSVRKDQIRWGYKFVPYYQKLCLREADENGIAILSCLHSTWIQLENFIWSSGIIGLQLGSVSTSVWTCGIKSHYSLWHYVPLSLVGLNGRPRKWWFSLLDCAADTTCVPGAVGGAQFQVHFVQSLAPFLHTEGSHCTDELFLWHSIR